MYLTENEIQALKSCLECVLKDEKWMMQNGFYDERKLDGLESVLQKINTRENHVYIRKEKFDEALRALKNICIPKNMTCISNGVPHFKYVDAGIVRGSEDFDEALREIRFHPVYDSNDDICNLSFTGVKNGDEAIFFKALAPYIESGSRLTYKTEENVIYIWRFENGEAKLEMRGGL